MTNDLILTVTWWTIAFGLAVFLFYAAFGQRFLCAIGIHGERRRRAGHFPGHNRWFCIECGQEVAPPKV